MNSASKSKFISVFLLDLERIVWRLACENSYSYFGQEFPNKSYGISRELLQEILLPHYRVIDIGCGGGRLCSMAADFSQSVLGIDTDVRSIEIANEYNRKKNVEYRIISANSLEGLGRFDIAILCGVLEHLDSTSDFLRNLHKITNKILIEVPDFTSDPLNLIRWNLNSRIYTDDDHVREYTCEGVLEQLKATDWDVIKINQQGLMITCFAVSKP